MFAISVHRFTSIGPIYYEYGSMVITFDSSNMAVIAYEILKNRRFEEKKLLVIMLPTIEPSMIPPKVLPLLVFVNVKSGGCQVIIVRLALKYILTRTISGTRVDFQFSKIVKPLPSVRLV